VTKLLRDLNLRFLRARYPSKSPEDAERMLDASMRERSRDRRHDVRRHPEDARPHVLPPSRRTRVPHGQRRGDPIPDVEDYIRHLAQVLPSAYLASRDMAQYRDLIRKVAAGEVTPEQAAKKSPVMKRKGRVGLPVLEGRALGGHRRRRRKTATGRNERNPARRDDVPRPVGRGTAKPLVSAAMASPNGPRRDP
jgi:hypothetical protein